jgi:AraC-like DNA-binding protein
MAVASTLPRPASIDATWEVEAVADASARILPDGGVDLLWHHERLWVAGPDRRARTAALIAGQRSCGVRLRPGAARGVLGWSGERLIDAVVPAAIVLGDEARSLESVLEAAAPPERPRLLTAWTERRAARRPGADPVVAATVAALERSPSTRIAAIARATGYSERQLRRRVLADVGYAPKLLGRVLRLQRALALANAHPDWSIADVAHVCGYADQAHLAQDSADLAAATPSELTGR